MASVLAELSNLTDFAQPEVLNPVADGIYAAGNPWFDYLLGNAARETLTRWMQRPASEVYVGRCAVLLDDNDCIGGIIGAAGSEIKRCRRSDGMATIMQASPEDRDDIQQRLTNAKGLFSAPADDEYYLSKIWLAPAYRGQGISNLLMDAWIQQGRNAGFRKFRLDVSFDNTIARNLYKRFGFGDDSVISSSDGAITYASMTLEKWSAN